MKITNYSIAVLTLFLASIVFGPVAMAQDMVVKTDRNHNWIATTQNNHDIEIIEQPSPEADRIYASGTFEIERNNLYIDFVRSGEGTPFRSLVTVQLQTETTKSGCSCSVWYINRLANATGGEREGIRVYIHQQDLEDFLFAENPRIKVDEFTFGLTPEFLVEFRKVWERAFYGIKID